MSTMNKTASSAFSLSSYPLAEPNSRMMEAGLGAWLATAGACQRDTAAFMTSRLEKDRDALREILGSRDLAHTAEVQTRWFEEAFRDYCSQMTKMIAVYARIGGSAAGKRSP